jgi:DNA gyrase inhibitor GyrI
LLETNTQLSATQRVNIAAPQRGHAVLAHSGLCTTLHQCWAVLCRGWLPSSGETLRDAPPLALCTNKPDTTPTETLLTKLRLLLCA